VTIFARRSIQRAIDALSAVLSRHQLSTLVANLNREKPDALFWEWEIMLLAYFAGRGELHHQAALGGSSELDVIYRATDGSGLEFVADIKCVTDDGAENSNPTELFFELLRKAVAKAKVPGGFDVKFEGKRTKTRDGEEVELQLPERPYLQAFFHSRIAPKIKEIARGEPGTPHRFHIDNEGIDVVIRYLPENRYTTGSYPAYRNATAIDRNPLARGLKSKREQLELSGYSGLKGIIICDGDCQVLRADHTVAWDSFSKREIVEKLFINTDKVSFVLLLWVVSDPRSHRFVIRSELHVNPRALFPMSASLKQLLEGIAQALPEPVQGAMNARLELQGVGFRKAKKYWGHQIGSYRMDGTRFQLSARYLMEALAVDGASDKLAEIYGFGKEGRPSNPFLNAIAKGKTIAAVKIERHPNEDDDLIEFVFEGPDPAVSRFEVPDAKPETE
jgi:hypothetical protein